MLILRKYSTSVIVKQYNLVAIKSSGNQVARDFNESLLNSPSINSCSNPSESMENLSYFFKVYGEKGERMTFPLKIWLVCTAVCI